MKKIFIILSAIVLSCSSDDTKEDCGCRFSETLNQQVPNSLTEAFIIENIDKISSAQKKSMKEECEIKCN